MQFYQRAVGFARQETALVSVLAIAASGIWGFISISEEVLEGETHAIDTAILLALRNPGDPADPLGPAWLEELGRDVTALGGVGILTFVTIASIIYLILRSKYHAAAFVAVSIASGIALSSLLKMGFDRPRPDLVPHGSIVYTASFPSGHSLMAALVYLTLGVLLARMQPRSRLKVYIMFLCVLITLCVGVSRVYLGVHWPTDVVAGWAAGAAWAMLSWAAVIWLQNRDAVEKPADPVRDGQNTQESR